VPSPVWTWRQRLDAAAGAEVEHVDEVAAERVRPVTLGLQPHQVSADADGGGASPGTATAASAAARSIAPRRIDADDASPDR
jgi:hypothetical protein